MRAGDPGKRIGRADKARQLAGRADAPRELFFSHVARSAPFLADTVWQIHSLSARDSAHAEQMWHGQVRSPCHKRSASSDEQRVDLGLCQTQRRRDRAQKAGGPTPGKGVRCVRPNDSRR